MVSDQFANLDPSEVIGSLVTIKSHTDNDSADQSGNVAIVTDYNAAANTVTIGGFYSNTDGDADGYNDIVTDSGGELTLDENDEVYITFASELENNVIRSEAPTSVTIQNNAAGAGNARISADQGEHSDNKKYVEVQEISTVVNSIDELIGATVTFSSGSFSDEKRTIVDVIEGYAEGGSGAAEADDVILVFDRELTSAAATTDSFTISFEEITATIEEVDFSTGVISTRDKMNSAMGSRNFNIPCY